MNPEEFDPAWSDEDLVNWLLFGFAMTPDEDWCLYHPEEDGKHDSIGHLGARQVTNQNGRETIQWTPAALAFMALTKKYLGTTPDNINDNSDNCPPSLRQIPTPKGRTVKAMEIISDAVSWQRISMESVKVEAEVLRQEVREEVVDSIPL
ncbi:MAG: hypothetical protein KC587_18640 [Nitrospira sp.]|nr:hypothetical protein [Nitrospira sp.]